MDEKNIFYTYKDKYGQGINPQHLITYSESIIFDRDNRSLYANGNIVGNHFFNSYHGEVYNDYNTNKALGDYSSASGHDTQATGNYSTATGLSTIAQSTGSFATGTYNSPSLDSLLTVGNGSQATGRSNAFEVKQSGDVVLSGQLISNGTDLISYVYNSYNYIRELTANTASDAQIKELSSKVSYIESLASSNSESISYLVQIDDQLASDIEQLQIAYNNLAQYTSGIETRLSDLETSYNNLKSSYDDLSSYTYSQIARLSNLSVTFKSNGDVLEISHI